MMADEMAAEFDTVAVWTERVVRDLGPEYAIPAACRGSGSPAWLRWLADGLGVSAAERFLDAGAGLGGPAAWLHEDRGTAPVLAEPMEGACVSARRLFGLPTAAAWSEALPFRDGAFDAAWLLGVLCTTGEKRALLGELRRVLTPDGRLGLLVLVQVVDELVDPPDGNEFPTPATLPADLTAAGFTIEAQVKASELPEADEKWQTRVAEVEDALTRRYPGRDDWKTAHEQEGRIGRLLRDGDIETWLICARVA
jgi:SAM-dependent methyltransferase